MAVVHTDAFTTATDEALESYDADYVKVGDSGGPGSNAIELNPSLDVAEVRWSGTIHEANSAVYRWAGTGTPTGDQEVSLDGTLSEAGSRVGAALRCATAANTAYLSVISPGGGRIYRRVAGVDTLIASDSVTVSQGTTYAIVADAQGTTTVELSLTIDANAALTYSDSSGDRLESGQPGLYMHKPGSANATAERADNLSIDDLAAAGSTVTLTTSLAAVSALSGSLVRTRGITATLDAVSALSASLDRTRGLNSILSAQSAISAALSTGGVVDLAVAIAAVSAASASLSVSRPLSTSAASTSTTSANLSRTRGLSAAITSLSALSATVSVQRGFSSSLAGQSELSAGLSAIRSLTSDLSAVSLINVSLSSTGDVVAEALRYRSSRARMLTLRRGP